MKNKGYKITADNKNTLPCLWDSQSEALIALLASRLSEIRELDAFKIVNDLNYNYLRKKKSLKKNNYTATKFQRIIILKEGY